MRYSGYAVEGSTYYEFETVQMQTDVLYGESYAILEEDNTWEVNTTFQYEVLYVSDDGLILKKFYRKKLDNVQTLESHPLFQSTIWIIEETASEYINEEDIIQIVTQDVYASKVPTNSSTYRYLLERSELFEQFFEDLYTEMDNYYNGVKQDSPEKWDFANFLQSEYGVQLEQSEGADIVLSNCLGLMRKLNLTYAEMAEYFCKYVL
ncbi:hypothetical protein [Ureibacillus aquaedulcis]|uniref:Uncharacterized protein n=1 Tax=Ureibacillus aquaedulcis TaxID=3058421 RepID=A0ABT8GTS4_9BACL|nr:hypothetical protein [Ureibacillus sp. BA0131]MDN4494624.1 hypothetical protein [Ureibacillus sp. BA0131]